MHFSIHVVLCDHAPPVNISCVRPQKSIGCQSNDAEQDEYNEEIYSFSVWKYESVVKSWLK